MFMHGDAPQNLAKNRNSERTGLAFILLFGTARRPHASLSLDVLSRPWITAAVVALQQRHPGRGRPLSTSLFSSTVLQTFLWRTPGCDARKLQKH
jgi:hypothetical protein